MARIGNPMKCPELDLQPEPMGGVELSENMQQTLALLTAFWRNKRVLLKASPSGVLFTASPRLQAVLHLTATGDNYETTGPDVPCTEIMVMGHPDNTGLIWLRPDIIATVTSGWPIAANAVMGFTLDNLRQLNLLIILNTEKAIIAYG